MLANSYNCSTKEGKGDRFELEELVVTPSPCRYHTDTEVTEWVETGHCKKPEGTKETEDNGTAKVKSSEGNRRRVAGKKQSKGIWPNQAPAPVFQN